MVRKAPSQLRLLAYLKGRTRQDMGNRALGGYVGPELSVPRSAGRSRAVYVHWLVVRGCTREDARDPVTGVGDLPGGA